MKTCEKTGPVLKTLFQVIFREEEPSLKRAGSGSRRSTEPAERMFGKQSAEAKGSQPVKAIRFAGDSSEKSGSEQIADTQSLVSSSGIVHASELSEVEGVEEPIVKKPAKAGASKKPATKRPAASKAKARKQLAKGKACKG